MYPNNRSSLVYPNGQDSSARPGWGSRVYPNGRAAGRGLVGAGGVLGLRPRGSGFALAVRATRSPQLNEFI